MSRGRGFSGFFRGLKEKLFVDRAPKKEDQHPQGPPPSIPKFDNIMQQVQSYLGIEYGREHLYKEYDRMLEDSIISSALELYAEEATQISYETGKSFWIVSDNEFLCGEFEQFCRRLNLYEVLPDVCYNGCLYGDMFVEIFYGDDNRGIEFIDTQIHPGDVSKASIGNYVLGYHYDGQFYAARDFYHYKLPFSKPKKKDYWNFVQFDWRGKKYKVKADYGVSVLDNARKIYKVLNLLEIIMVIARITRSPMKEVIGVNCTGLTPTDAKDLVAEMKEAFATDDFINLNDPKTFDQQSKQFDMIRRVFVPIFEEKGNLNVTTLGGEADVREIVDIEYFRSKLYGALRTPKAFLGLEETLPGGIGESSLTRLEIRFAKAVKRVQSCNRKFLRDLFVLHLYAIGKGHLRNDFDIQMATISTAEDEERKSALISSLEAASSTLGLLTELGLVDEETAEVKKVDLIKVINAMFLKIPGFDELLKSIEKTRTELEQEKAEAEAEGGSEPVESRKPKSKLHERREREKQIDTAIEEVIFHWNRRDQYIGETKFVLKKSELGLIDKYIAMGVVTEVTADDHQKAKAASHGGRLRQLREQRDAKKSQII